MIIDDHINLTARTPLIGGGAAELGPLFPDMTQTWDPALSDVLFECGTAAGVPTARGVYVGVLGPSYETPAEVRMIGILGGDAVGMSTVFEAIAIRHMGGRLAGVSVISNAAAGTGEEGSTLDHAHVSDVAIEATQRFVLMMRGAVARRDQWWEA
jgi:purine-nucleoside phosphorylase